jgi:hypothetical protein
MAPITVRRSRKASANGAGDAEGLCLRRQGPRFATNRRVLAESGDSIEKFFASGVTELKEKLGPVNWQFMATKKFDPAILKPF